MNIGTPPSKRLAAIRAAHIRWCRREALLFGLDDAGTPDGDIAELGTGRVTARTRRGGG